MSSIKRTGPKPSSTTAPQRRSAGACGPAPRRASACATSACGGWVGRATRAKTGKREKSQKKAERKPASVAACGASAPRRNPGTVSSCGGAGWSRWGRIPSGC